MKTDSNYATTSEMARLCGVSRFTVINWVKQGKIKSISTPGGHRRIPLSEVHSFLGALHTDGDGQATPSDTLAPCCEPDEETPYQDKCRNCAIYKREKDYCLLLARQLCSEATHCERNCVGCERIEELFSAASQLEKAVAESAPAVAVGQAAGAARKSFLYSLSYRISYNVGRGMRGLKRGIGGLRARISRG